jgi:hypothetical protein
MIWAYLLIFGSTSLLGLSAVFALGWAGRTGQLRNFKAGSEVIFDAEEPIGLATDLVFRPKVSKGGPKTDKKGRSNT